MFRRSYYHENYLIVYIEKYIKANNEVLFDFIDLIEFELFITTTGFNVDYKNTPSMVLVYNYKQKNIVEGSFYFISLKTIKLLEINPIDEGNSAVIGFSINMNISNVNIFEKVKHFNKQEKYNRGMIDSENEDLSISSLDIKLIKEVVIRNIGQGNWNELKSSNSTELVFDAGTKYSTSKTDLKNMIAGRDQEYQKSNPIVIISHWDVDHYHFLLAFEDKTIQSFKHFIFRSFIPSNTAFKVIERFKSLNIHSLVPVAPFPKIKGGDINRLNGYFLDQNRNLIVYNSIENRSRNKSGIGLALRTLRTSVVFSGDYDYIQISKYILPYLNYKCFHYLVVPHHGGAAGKFSYNHSPANRLKDSIISVGNNPYKPKHPHKNNVDDLTKIGFNVLRTDYLGKDLVITI